MLRGPGVVNDGLEPGEDTQRRLSWFKKFRDWPEGKFLCESFFNVDKIMSLDLQISQELSQSGRERSLIFFWNQGKSRTMGEEDEREGL